MNAECRHGFDVAAFLAGELPPREQAGFQRHLADCAECREAVESTRLLLGRLRAVPPPEPARDLAPLILARLHEPVLEISRRPPWRRIASVAAIFAVFATALAVRDALHREPSAAPETQRIATKTDRALDWFVRTQEPDGSWSAERWGGQRNYAPALTALPLLALVTAENTTPEREAAAARAAASLRALQNADGSFGPVFQGSPYNQSITTLALLHAWQHRPDIVPKTALDAALAVLAKQQTPEGGWGYRYSPFADRSITQWHIQALDLAASLGWDTARPAVERGLAWLATHSTPLDDSAEPADSTSALLARATARPARADGTLDFYQAYFAASALKHEHTPAAQQRLAGLRSEILSHQITEGTESGSWPPDDQWGRAGGRLYSTALASLSLENR
jgi:hypothetical protein